MNITRALLVAALVVLAATVLTATPAVVHAKKTPAAPRRSMAATTSEKVQIADDVPDESEINDVPEQGELPEKEKSEKAHSDVTSSNDDENKKKTVAPTASKPGSSLVPFCLSQDNFDIRASVFEHLDETESSAQCLLLPAVSRITTNIQGPEQESPFRGTLRGSVFKVLWDLHDMVLPPTGKDRPTFTAVGEHVANALKSVSLWKFVKALHPVNIQLALYKQIVEVLVEYPEPSVTTPLDSNHMLFLFRPPTGRAAETVASSTAAMMDSVICGEARYMIPTHWSQWLKGEAQGRRATQDGYIQEYCRFQLSSFVGDTITIALHKDNSQQITNGHAGFSHLPEPEWRQNHGTLPTGFATEAQAALVPKLTVTVTHELDSDTLRLIVTMVLIILLHATLVNNKIIQAFVSLAFGVIICLSVLIYFTTKDIGKTRAGKVGLIALIGAGGWAAVIEGMGSAVIGFALAQLTDNMIVQGVFAACVVGTGYFTHSWFGKQLKYATDVTLVSARYIISGYLCYYHPEMMLGFFSLRMTLLIITTLLQLLGHNVGGRRYGEAQDWNPRMAQGAGDFRRPVAQGVGGRNAAERMRAYNSQGKSNTTRELDALANFCRENPKAWVNKMRNPNLMSDFVAGTCATADDDVMDDE